MMAETRFCFEHSKLVLCELVMLQLNKMGFFQQAYQTSPKLFPLPSVRNWMLNENAFTRAVARCVASEGFTQAERPDVFYQNASLFQMALTGQGNNHPL